MLRVEKCLRLFLIGLVIVMSVLYALALFKSDLHLKPVNVPDFSQATEHFDTLSANLIAEAEKLSAIPKRIQNLQNGVLQFWESITDSKR